MTNSKRVAILVTNGFEQVEITEPRKALEEAGFKTDLVSPAKGEVQGWKHDDRAKVPRGRGAGLGEFERLRRASLPGGVLNPDELRTIPKAVEFVKSFFRTTNRLRRSATVPDAGGGGCSAGT